MSTIDRSVARTSHAAIGLGLLLLALGAAAPLVEAESAPAGKDTTAENKLAAEAGRDRTVAEALKAEVTVDDDAPTPSAKQPERPETKPPGKLLPDGRREMTLEEIRDLPILKRYDLPFEKGEELLGDVKDRTFDYDESAFWYMVSKVAGMPPEAFEPDEQVTGYPQLLATPSAHRGKPVTIRGVYLTVTPFRTPVLAVRKDVPVLYEVNLREPPMHERRPVATVIVMENPMTYLRVNDDVLVKGYFYKVRKYEGSKGVGFSPMLVAQRLERQDRSPAHLRSEPGLSSGQIQLYLMIGIVAVLGVAFLWMRYRNKAKTHATGARPIHRIRLRRPDRPEPFADGGPGGEGGEPKS